AEHFAYVNHECPAPNTRDVQVPTCPLCGTVVPGRRGEPPDVATKEMVPLVCAECSLNYCLRHRHVTDHACEGKLAAKRRQAADVPLVCAECSLNYCLRHRHVTDHACEGKLAAKRRQAADVPLVCAECSLNYCLRHRHVTDHACEGKLAAKRRQAA
ncbi:putative zinc finger, AN1 type domain 2B, partial [Operophtera brumata]